MALKIVSRKCFYEIWDIDVEHESAKLVEFCQIFQNSARLCIKWMQGEFCCLFPVLFKKCYCKTIPLNLYNSMIIGKIRAYYFEENQGTVFEWWKNWSYIWLHPAKYQRSWKHYTWWRLRKETKQTWVWLIFG